MQSKINSLNKALLTLSATFATAYGLWVIFKPEQAAKQFHWDTSGASPFFMQMQGIYMVGWGVGKFTAVIEGMDPSVTTFALFNLLPMGMMIMNGAAAKNTGMAIGFTLTYLFIGMTGLRANKQPSEWAAGYYFLCFSACIALTQGIRIIVTPEQMLADGSIGSYNHPDMALVKSAGVAAVGWGVGKLTAIHRGDRAIRLFCILNLVPMGLMVGFAYLAKNFKGAGEGGALLLCYAFLAATGPKTSTYAKEVSTEPLLSA